MKDVQIPISSASALDVLKEQFMRCLGNLSKGGHNLRTAVHGLLERGVTKTLLLQWAIDAGFSEGYARTVLNRVLREEHGARRKSGAGPKTPPEAIALLDLAIQRHGEDGIKFLLSGYRAGKERLAAKAELARSPLRLACVGDDDDAPHSRANSSPVKRQAATHLAEKAA